MQLSIVTNEQDIHAAQKQLQDRIRVEGGPLRRYRIGNRRGQGEVEVCHVERVGLWHTVERLDNRWSNGFGLGDPATVAMLTVVTWIQSRLRRLATIWSRHVLPGCRWPHEARSQRAGRAGEEASVSTAALTVRLLDALARLELELVLGRECAQTWGAPV